MLSVKERLNRFNEEDIVFIGNLYSDFKGSDMYQLLSAVTENQIMAELSDMGSKENSDKRIGRLEGIRAVLTAFETYEKFRDQVLAQKKEEEKEKTPLEEPAIRQGGGGI